MYLFRYYICCIVIKQAIKIPMKQKKYAFAASDCNVIVNAASKKIAVQIIREQPVKGADKANINNVFLYN